MGGGQLPGKVGARKQLYAVVVVVARYVNSSPHNIVNVI